MILSYCYLCHKTITLEVPPPKENISPTNGHLICHNCWDNNFSPRVIRSEKLNKLLNPKPKDKFRTFIKSILKWEKN